MTLRLLETFFKSSKSSDRFFSIKFDRNCYKQQRNFSRDLGGWILEFLSRSCLCAEDAKENRLILKEL